MQKGESIDHTPVADVAAGDVVVIGNIVGVAKLDIPNFGQTRSRPSLAREKLL
ncbi:MAG: DUF2190 family protein [Puniceicoccales bacterium]|nr:DUF2190 family protein [Puniceicoccales bacterium]